MELTPDTQRVVLGPRLRAVATVDAHGRPAVSPKGTTTVFDDRHPMFADVASPGTVANIGTNPHVAIDVVDPIVRQAYRFAGTASVHADGERYERARAVVEDRGSAIGRDRIRDIVVGEVTDASPLVSTADGGGASEDEIATRCLHHHAEMHGG